MRHATIEVRSERPRWISEAALYFLTGGLWVLFVGSVVWWLA